MEKLTGGFAKGLPARDMAKVVLYMHTIMDMLRTPIMNDTSFRFEVKYSAGTGDVDCRLFTECDEVVERGVQKGVGECI